MKHKWTFLKGYHIFYIIKYKLTFICGKKSKIVDKIQ